MNTKLLFFICFFSGISFVNDAISQSCTTDQFYVGVDTRENTIQSNPATLDGQTFLASNSGWLYSVALDLSASNTVCVIDSMDVQISILAGDSIDGAPLTTEIFRIPVNFTRIMDTFSFANPATVLSGSRYTITASLVPGQLCDSIEPELIWFFEFPTNFWVNTGGVQFQDGVITSLGNTQYFSTCVGSGLGVSKNNTDLENTMLYPNPFSNNLTVLSNNDILGISVLNIYGEEILYVHSVGKMTELDLSKFSNGIYFINVATEFGIETTKVIKE